MSGSFDDVLRRVITEVSIFFFTDCFGAFFVAIHLFYLLYRENKVLLGIIYLAGYLLFGLREQQVGWLRVGNGLVIGKAVVVIVTVNLSFLLILFTVKLTHCFQSEFI